MDQQCELWLQLFISKLMDSAGNGINRSYRDIDFRQKLPNVGPSSVDFASFCSMSIHFLQCPALLFIHCTKLFFVLPSKRQNHNVNEMQESTKSH